MTQARATVTKNGAIDEIAKIISQITGNQFSEKHQSMIEFRLQKRCLDLKIDSIENYFNFFKANQTTEVNNLVSLLTTHHTFFFREYMHFQFLEDHALPEIIPIVRKRQDKKIRVWSAACSKGHEVYSLAMFLDHTLKQLAPDLSYHIVGSDIDSESLSHAYNGVYTRRDIKEVPMNFLGNHWERGTGDVSEFVKARSTLRTNVSFKQINLLNFPQNFTDKFDIIFCRNVFIYFDQEQIKKSSLEIIRHLEPHGYYIVALSENISNLGLPLFSRGPSIFSKLSVVPSQTQTATTGQTKTTTPPTSPSATLSATSPTASPVPSTHTSTTNTLKSNTTNPEKTGPLRVLCVDDSPSILALLENILKFDGSFEVVGKAINGAEAEEKIKTLKPDLVTMDIHMPILNGVEYMRKNFKAGHPPVIMISSVSREEADLALQALNYGASDYVEKPALSNIKEVSEEIIRKLKCAYRNRSSNTFKPNLKLDESFKKTTQIKEPKNFLRVILGTLSDKNKIQSVIKELGANQPPTIILLDGAKDTLQGISKSLGFKNSVIETWPTSALLPNEIYVADAKKFSSQFSQKIKETPASILLMAGFSPNFKNVLENWKKAQILLEDLGQKENLQSPFKVVSTDIVPATSFAYMSIEYLSKI